MDSITIFRAAGDERGEAYALLDLASVQGWARKYEEAIASAARAKSLCTAVHDRRGACWTDLCMADLLREQGDLAVARDIYQRCHVSFDELGDQVGTAHVLMRRGIVEVLLGDAESGHSSWRDAVELYARAHMPESGQLNEWLARPPPTAMMRAGIGRLRFPLDLT